MYRNPTKMKPLPPLPPFANLEDNKINQQINRDANKRKNITRNIGAPCLKPLSSHSHLQHLLYTGAKHFEIHGEEIVKKARAKRPSQRERSEAVSLRAGIQHLRLDAPNPAGRTSPVIQPREQAVVRNEQAARAGTSTPSTQTPTLVEEFEDDTEPRAPTPEGPQDEDDEEMNTS